MHSNGLVHSTTPREQRRVAIECLDGTIFKNALVRVESQCSNLKEDCGILRELAKTIQYITFNILLSIGVYIFKRNWQFSDVGITQNLHKLF